MSVFDLFRGFFGVPGGNYRDQRDPFFDVMNHDDDYDDDEDDGSLDDGFRRDQQDPFDGAWRFSFSFGPDGMRTQEPPMFGQVLREMEEILSQLNRWEGLPESGHTGVPLPPPPRDRAEGGGGASSGNPLRDFMLKSDDDGPRGPQGGASREPGYDGHKSPEFPNSPFHAWTPFSKFNDIWEKAPQKPQDDKRKEDRDLDSAVSSRGLDKILSPPADQAPDQPQTRSFFHSVTVTTVVKPDGVVEERRVVRDNQGNEKTTVARSRGPNHLTGGEHLHTDMHDDKSLFSKFFGGFK